MTFIQDIVKQPFKNLVHGPETLKLCLGAYFPRRTASRYDFLRADAT